MNHRELLSGQRRDPLAFCLRGLLRLAEVPYTLVVKQRNRSFDTGNREIVRCDIPVISIGNLTTGGTGKTPLVCFLAKHLRRSNLRVTIISRGYGAQQGEENDEAMELARELPDVPHVQNPNRVEAANLAIEELEAEILLLDDGFQHRRLDRDLDIVVIDATNPFGYGHLLPRGLLREPILSLSRADAVILSRADMVDEDHRQRIYDVVINANANVIWAEAVHAPKSLLSWPEQHRPIEALVGKRIAIVTAIGNPDAFISTVARCGAEIVASKVLPDHDRYSRETVDSIVTWLNQLDDPSIELICTHKDLVKLQTDRLAGRKVSAIAIELQLSAGASQLLNLVDQVAAKARG